MPLSPLGVEFFSAGPVTQVRPLPTQARLTGLVAVAICGPHQFHAEQVNAACRASTRGAHINEPDAIGAAADKESS